MRDTRLRAAGGELWALVSQQHGVVTRQQLLARGLTSRVIAHRVRSGRLHPVYRGVYAVGRPHLESHGRWMAAVLACGSLARLSHTSGGALYEVIPLEGRARIHVSVPADVYRRIPGAVVHRREALSARNDVRHHGIPVTDPVSTMIDLATVLTPRQLETAINEADKRDLVSADQLRSALERFPRRTGVPALRALLDQHTFTLTDSDLEKLFLPIARGAGVARPKTRLCLNGFRVDFFWPDLGLVVETDGLRYHRTPAEQARDRLRDQTHTAAGLTPLRFTHAQIAFEPEYVSATLEVVARRLSEAL